MLTEIYIEALPVDGNMADQVWEAWNNGEVDNYLACFAWWHISLRSILLMDNEEPSHG